MKSDEVDHGDYDHNCIAAIVPALNEEVTIGSVVLQLKRHANKVIVVDDGSVDKTSEVARMAGAEVIRLEENHGKAYAVKKGIDALKGQDLDAVVMVDGDGQHRVSDLPAVLAPLLRGEADLVIGSRLICNGHRVPTYRRFGQWVMNRFTNMGAKERLTDTQSGFRAMNMNGVMNMDFNCDGYGLESGMIVHFASRGLTIKEVPIDVRYDVPNKHKKNPITMGLGLVDQAITLIGLRRPLMFISVPGLLLSLMGVFLGLATLGKTYFLDWSWFMQGAVAAFLTMLGTILVVSGLTLNTVGHIVNQRDIGRDSFTTFGEGILGREEIKSGGYTREKRSPP